MNFILYLRPSVFLKSSIKCGVWTVATVNILCFGGGLQHLFLSGAPIVNHLGLFQIDLRARLNLFQVSISKKITKLYRKDDIMVVITWLHAR